jgi:integrase
LRWEDIDLERGQLCVRRSSTRGIETSPKNNRIRYVPLTNELARALKAARRTDGYVFEIRGQQVTQAMAWRALQTARTRAGLRHVGWHTMRHSFASHLVSENVPIVAVQMLLGHSDIKMTQRYAHVAPSLLRGAVQQIVTARERANADRRQPTVNRSEQEANTPLLGTGAQLATPLR